MANSKWTDRINACGTVVMTVATVAMAVFAFQSNRLSQRVALTAEEPILELSVAKNGETGPLSYELFNGSSFELENISIADYFYAGNLNLDFESGIPIGGQTVVPQFNIARLLPAGREKLSTMRFLSAQEVLPLISSGNRVAILHLELSFRHAITHKQYERSDRFIILPSEAGWTISRVTNGVAWAVQSHGRKK